VKVTVRVQGHLRRYRPEGFELELPDAATVRMLIDASGIPWEEVLLVAVNGKRALEADPLHDGDQVMLLAPMEGG